MVTSVRLQNFRSYGDSSFEFESNVNIVVGPNASGKTNLLEAVLALGQGGSFRAKDIDLVMFDAPWARLDGLFDGHERTLKLEKDAESYTKRFAVDGKVFTRLSFDRTLPVVYFEPNHLQLISRGPSQRRDYIDELLERTQPGFKAVRRAYRRTLAQRNNLLKKRPDGGDKQLFVWNVRLSELGESIAKSRKQLTDSINDEISDIYGRIAKKKAEASINYQHQFNIDSYGSNMLKKLETGTSLDYLRGFTAYGPHREDFCINLNAKPASVSASRGEMRSLLLSLKIFELGQVEKSRGQKPIFLLDDVFSELDGARRRALVGYLKKHQTIITTTDADTVVEYFAGGSQKLISLSK